MLEPPRPSTPPMRPSRCSCVTIRANGGATIGIDQQDGVAEVLDA